MSKALREAASRLGRSAKGVKKTITEEERQRRIEHMREVNSLQWGKDGKRRKEK